MYLCTKTYLAIHAVPPWEVINMSKELGLSYVLRIYIYTHSMSGGGGGSLGENYLIEKGKF